MVQLKQRIFTALMMLIIISSLNGVLLKAQPSQLWIKNYHNENGLGYEGNHKSVIDQEGNIYCIGSTSTQATSSDILVLKYSPDGTLLWSKSYNYSFNGTENSNDLCLDNSGNVYITGTSTRQQGGYYDGILLKYSSDGQFQWVKRFSKSTGNERTGEGKSLIFHNYIYVEAKFVYNGNSECGIIKFSTSGDSLEYLSMGILPNTSYRPVKIVRDNNNNIYAALTGNVLANEGRDIIIKKISNNGILSLVWTKAYTGTSHLDDNVYDVAVGPDGSPFITGYTEVTNQSFNVLLLKLGRDDGAILIEKTYNNDISNYQDVGSKISFDANSNIYIAGSTSVMNVGADILLLKYSPSGSMIYTKIYVHPGNRTESTYDMTMDSFGNQYIISPSFTSGESRVLTAKFGSDGELQWYIEEFTGEGNTPTTINLDNNGNVVISATTKLNDVYYNTVIKYGSTIGIQQISGEVPEQFSLKQNYPNPFNPVTNISFSIPNTSNVKLTVYDAAGKEVEQLVNNQLNAGNYSFEFDASNLSSGVYFYKLSAGSYTDVKKMILVK